MYVYGMKLIVKVLFFFTFKHSILQVFLHHLWSKRFSFPMVTLLKMHQLTCHGSISRLYPVLWYTLVSPHRSILAAERQVLKVLQLFSLLQGCPTPHLHRLTAIPAILFFFHLRTWKAESRIFIEIIHVLHFTLKSTAEEIEAHSTWTVVLVEGLGLLKESQQYFLMDRWVVEDHEKALRLSEK